MYYVEQYSGVKDSFVFLVFSSFWQREKASKHNEKINTSDQSHSLKHLKIQ